MTIWRSDAERISAMDREITDLKSELKQSKDTNQDLQQRCHVLKVQNDRLVKMEAEHEKAKASLIHKRVIISRAVILVPDNLVIGDRLENCTIQIYRGNNVTISDRAELINCRIIGLNHYFDEAAGRQNRHTGTIEIRGVFYNADPRKYAISTYERVVIHTGSKFRGNIRAGRIIISELTRVQGRLASRDLIPVGKKRQYTDTTRLESNILEAQEA